MYSHTQVGWMTVIALVGAIIATGAAGSKLGLAGTPAREPLMAVMTILALMLPLLGWLTVTVDAEAVTVRFGIGLIRKKMKLKDIRTAAPVRNKWYYGWGVRLGPWGWMYNVSGLDAVEVELRSGGRFRIGTDEPEELARAIKQGL